MGVRRRRKTGKHGKLVVRKRKRWVLAKPPYSPQGNGRQSSRWNQGDRPPSVEDNLASQHSRHASAPKKEISRKEKGWKEIKNKKAAELQREEAEVATPTSMCFSTHKPGRTEFEKKEGTGVGAKERRGRSLGFRSPADKDVLKKGGGSEEMLLEGWRTPDLQSHRIIKLS